MDLANRFKKLFKKNISYKCHIEHILPSKIIGWISFEKNNYEEVIFMYGKHKISKAFINEERLDVANELGINNKFLGFTLSLPSEIPIIKEKHNLSLIARNNKSNTTININNINTNGSLNEKINYLFDNDYLLGLEGHIDGLLDDDCIHGWCSNKKEKKFQTIWMRIEDEKPIKIICDQFRIDLESIGVNSKSGFIFPKKDIPKSFINKKISFSFDKKGILKIPQEQTIEIIKNGQNSIHPVEKNVDIVNLNSEIESPINNLNDYFEYQIFINNPNSKFAKEWKKINEFKLLLDKLEKKIESKPRHNFFSKFKMSLFK